jgi:tetratricopeptide (TPR) repeat protein
MMTRQAHLRAGLVGVAAALSVVFALANDGAAQVSPRAAGTSQDGSTVPIAQAMTLEAQANELCSCRTNCLRIARLYEEEASLRSEDDPQRAVDYQLAAVAYHHEGKLREAQRNATAAADAFLMIGDVLNAAHQFIDAATVAQERKRHEEALRFVQRAECLSQSPLLSLAQAELIRGRIQPTGRVLLVKR